MKLKIILFSILFLFSISFMHCGAIFESKPRVEVQTWNKTVEQNERTMNNHQWLKQVAPKKFYKQYKCIYIAQGDIDSREYKREHPDDLLVKEIIPGTGQYAITVFSDQPIPDNKFFKYK